MVSLEHYAPHILIVDDEPNNLKVLHKLLIDNGYEVHATRDGKSAIDATLQTLPDLILLDINMPQMGGYEVCKRLKAMPETADIPIVFISAHDDKAHIQTGFEVGGVDYITKPIQFHEVLARVNVHVNQRLGQQELQEKLMLIQEMQAKERQRFEKVSTMRSQFIQAATHDLKNPLFTIMGYADLIHDMSAASTPEQISEFSQHISNSSEKMSRLIANMLDLLHAESKHISIDLRMVNFQEFILEQLDLHQLNAQEKSIDIQFNTDTPTLQVALDIDLFSRVVDNLVSNAIKYSPDNRRIFVSINSTSDAVILDVADEGYGMSQETLDNLFEPFYRAVDMQKREIEGTGLGLSVMRELVHRHEGDIQVESELGQGSVFRVFLPRKNIADLM